MTEFPEDEVCWGGRGLMHYCTSEPTNTLIVEGGGWVLKLCDPCLESLEREHKQYAMRAVAHRRSFQQS